MRLLIYQQYLIKNILFPVIIITFVITSIMWIIQSLRFLYLIDRGIKILDFLNIIIFIIPSLLYIILPFVTLLAVLYTYNSLSNENELVILKNSNINDFKLTVPALIVGLIITLISYSISLYLMPITYTKLKININYMRDNYTSKIINEKEFNEVAKDIIVYIDTRTKDGTMHGIILFDNRSNDKSQSSIILSNTGSIKLLNNQPIFELKKGVRHSNDANNNLTKLYFDSLTVELKSQISSNNINLHNRNMKEYSIQELFHNKQEKNTRTKNKLIVEGHQRLTWPLYNFIFPFLALSIWFKFSYNRETDSTALIIIISVITLITFLHFSIQNIAINNLKLIYIIYSNILLILVISIILFKFKKI